MKKTYEQIMKRMQEHYDAIKNDYEIVGLFLQGSQNYGVDYDGSDIDTKAIVLPKFEDFVKNKKAVSFTYIMDNEEHIDIKDIRVMFESFKKQNINFIEIIYTDYKIINPKYEELFSSILENREKISRYNIHQALNCMSGMCMEKYKAMCHRYPTIEWKIDKWGYDGKQLQHMFRVRDFMINYINGVPYKDCLKVKDIDVEKQILIKTNKYYNLEEAKIQAKILLDESKQIKDDYISNHENIIDNEVNKILESVIILILKQFFKEQLMED